MDPQHDPAGREDRPIRSSPSSVHSMGEVLDEWLAQVQQRFPDLQLFGAETPATVG